MTVIKIQETITRELEVDVTFPIYCRHDIDGDGWCNTYYMRREADGTCYSICHRDSGSFEVEIRHESFSGSSADYILGRGMHKSSAAEFDKALTKARETLSKCDVTADRETERHE